MELVVGGLALLVVGLFLLWPARRPEPKKFVLHFVDANTIVAGMITAGQEERKQNDAQSHPLPEHDPAFERVGS